MEKMKALNKDEVSRDSQVIYDELNDKAGMVANVYKVAANSPQALKGIIDLTKTLNRGQFSKQEIQAIDLVIAEVSDCDYCRAAHTDIGKQVGWTEEETQQLRTGSFNKDEKIDALVKLSREIVKTNGNPDESTIQAFADVGYTHEHLAELIGWVAVNIFTNYTNHIAGTEIDFPEAQSLHAQSA